MSDPFIFNFDASVTNRQRQWFNDALARTRFPVTRGGATIYVQTVAEPSAPGHNDYMSTTVDDGGTLIEIRIGADDPTAPFNRGLPDPPRSIQAFFMESVIHEVVGHAFWFNHFNNDTDKTSLASMFRRSYGGEEQRGTLADWNPLAVTWGDRIQEAVAEFSKDVYLPSESRVYDNRTNWTFDESRFGDFFDLVESYTCFEVSNS